MHELFNILILAKSEGGIVEMLFFVVVAALGIIGSVVSNIKKKQEEQKQQQRVVELRKQATEEEDAPEDWIVVEQEPTAVSPPPVQAARPQNVTAIGNFVKSARQRLVPDQPIRKSEPIPVPIPIPSPTPVTLQSSGMEQTSFPSSSRPPKVVHNRSAAKAKKARLAASGNRSGTHRTVQYDDTSPPVSAETSRTTIQFNAAAARQAMIYHEIFSQPKALRNSHELWD